MASWYERSFGSLVSLDDEEGGKRKFRVFHDANEPGYARTSRGVAAVFIPGFMSHGKGLKVDRDHATLVF